MTEVEKITSMPSEESLLEIDFEKLDCELTEKIKRLQKIKLDLQQQINNERREVNLLEKKQFNNFNDQIDHLEVERQRVRNQQIKRN